MDELYAKVSSATKKVLYQYMKDTGISLLNYNFNYFFQYCIQKSQIQVISHHFSNNKIEGLTVVDELGISFSYERDNPKVKQNFTLCHELGHYILKHEGSCFMELVGNQNNLSEREANIFSAVVLMPDIVLLSKIYYNRNTFQKMQHDLKVSKSALCFRIQDLLRCFFPEKDTYIKQSIEKYIRGENVPLIYLFHNIKERIIKEFNEYKPSLFNQIKEKMETIGFATSQDFPELLNQEKWNQLKNRNSNLKVWLIYNRGKSIAYVWDNSKLSEREAKKKAEQQLLLI